MWNNEHNLIFLEPYYLDLSPIEDVWHKIKSKIYKSIYETLNELIEIFKEKYYKIVDDIILWKLGEWIFRHEHLVRHYNVKKKIYYESLYKKLHNNFKNWLVWNAKFVVNL